MHEMYLITSIVSSNLVISNYLLLLIGTSLNYAKGFGFRNVQYFGPTVISEGDPFALSCVTPFHDSSTWTLNGTIVIDGKNVLGFELLQRKLYSFYQEMIVRTVSAQLYQTGEYRCNGNSRSFHFLRVVEDGANVAKPTAEMDFPERFSTKHKRDNVAKYPKRYYFEEGVTYEFPCNVKDERSPVLWYKDMQQIDQSINQNIDFYGQYLVIHNAQIEDIGEYSCRLESPFGFGSRHILSKFIIASPAEIVDISERQNVIRGRSMTLFCRARGYPPPKITWYIGNLNAYLLKEKDLRISVYSKREDFSNAYLTLRNMSYFDRHLYTCRVENGIPTEDNRLYNEKSVAVHVRENIIEPNEDIPGFGKLLTPGETLVLECKTEECPYCSIVWSKDGEMIIDNHTIKIHEANNTLVIDYATINDTGVYECAVDRKQLNVDLSATIQVRVCEDFLNKGYTIDSICEFPVSHGNKLCVCSILLLSTVIFILSSIM